MTAQQTRRRPALLALSLLLLAGGCTTPVRDSGPAREPRIDFSRIPDAVPVAEPRSRYGNPSSYAVNGRTYRVMASAEGFVQRGLASWYGTKFHGRRTSSGEPYDMYAMTAAHKSLPLPSYVRVTHLASGKSVVVRVNDRGPFHDGRIIDLSYAAARKLGISRHGTAEVEIRALFPQAPVTAAVPEAVQARPARLAAAAHVEAPRLLPVPPPSPAAETVATPVATPLPAVTAPPLKTARPAAVSAAEPARLYLQVGAFADRTNAERLRERLATSLSPVSISTAEGAPTIYRVRIGPLQHRDQAGEFSGRLRELGIHNARVVHEAAARL